MMSGSPHSPLTRLVLFTVCLSIAGTFVAGAHYVTVDLPQQNVLQAPANTDPGSCFLECASTARACFKGCGGNGGCSEACRQTAYACGNGCNYD
jgi:hypothetical protein